MEESGKIKYREKEEANMEWNNEIKENFDNISKKLRVIFLKMQEGKTTIEMDGKNITIIVRDIGDGYLPTIIRTSDKKDIFVIKNNIMYKKIKKLENTEFGVNIENENIKINEESIDLEVIKDIKNMIKIYKDSKDIIMKFSHKEIVEKIMKLIINKFKIDFENQNIEIYPLEEINKSDSMLNPNLEEIKKFSKENNRKFKKHIFKYKKIMRNLNSKGKMKKLTKKYRSR